MRPSLLDYLACPGCGERLRATFAASANEIWMTGELECEACAASYRIAREIPRMNRDMSSLQNVARTFGYEWKAHDEGKFEHETLWGRTPEEDWEFFLVCMGLSEENVRGATILDAGCGSGHIARLAAEHGAALVVGVDINEAVDEAARRCSDLENVEIVQGNILALPLRKAAFDLVWCSGVLHHTPNAAEAHHRLSRHVKPGGTLYVWVYAKRFNPFRFVKSVLDVLRVTRLPLGALLILSKVISYPSAVLLWCYRALRWLRPLRPRTAWAKRTVRPRKLREIQLTWFDALSPEYDSRHTEAEVIAWFEREGFEGITPIEEPKVGVRGTAPRATRRSGSEGV
jgi:SAM-dependent methyltransferase